jgi:tryptophan synthase alpha chain
VIFTRRRRQVGDDPIASTFERCRREKRAAFIPYLTAGDPDLATSARLVEALARGGADIIELGVPFSDPIADGPVNQRAAYRALRSGTSLSGVLELVSQVRADIETPIVLFTYYNPIQVRGVEHFAEQASASGVDGILCVDLPPEEGGELVPALVEQGIDPVFLLAPTSTRDRIRKVAEASRGFVYYVSRTGVTGERSALSASLASELRRVRRIVGLPIAVGFGISTPEQAKAVARLADGVVVGSALVRIVEEHSNDPDLPDRLEQRVRELAAGLRR